MAVYTAEPGSLSHDALNLLARGRRRWTGPRRPTLWTDFDRQRHNPLTDPDYGAGFTGHGAMVMPNLGAPGSTMSI